MVVRNVAFRYCTSGGDEVATTWARARADLVVQGHPIRIPPTFRDQKNYPGLFWSSTNRRQLVYESLLELDHLWLADFDQTVIGICTQPFQLAEQSDNAQRTHVPDILLTHADQRVTLVDVKPQHLLDEPSVRKQFEWTRALCEEKGWHYEIFSGGDSNFPERHLEQPTTKSQQGRLVCRCPFPDLVWRCRSRFGSAVEHRVGSSTFGTGTAMSTTVLDVSVGSRLWYQGTAWTIVELDGFAVTLRSAEQFKRVHAPALAGIAQPLDEDRDGEDSGESSDAVVIASLTPKQRRQIESEARVYEQVVIVANDESFQERCTAAGEQLGISARSVRRRAERYTRHGLSGLVDARLLKPKRRSIAPEWDQACIEVLDSFTRLSNPTMGMVIRKANALYLQRYPDGVEPTRAAAYRRLHELDKGRYTFGAAKQRRSVAERPQGHMGRLRADRPGQYVVLDTIRLDVFAMEPITGRWLNTELTVAMDLYSRCHRSLHQSHRPIDYANYPNVSHDNGYRNRRS
ncbi:TnsA-like heteromeric transposase endonuclease subunit [Brevibacterium sp. ZH18]|nr:TnsA-like heteromeric transposase endonuclease subunit [Brevibacterium sp. ZH18]